MDILLPKFIKYQLYLLQLENYELPRYWKLLKAKGFWPSRNIEQRKDLVWTTKAKALLLMAASMHVLLAVIISVIILGIFKTLDSAIITFILTAVILLPFYFLLFSLALWLIMPLDTRAKNKIVAEAQAKLKTLPNLKIVGIAGSYGKTTMKEVLAQVLGSRFKVLATPESINTPVGLSRYILNKVSLDTQVLIVEMGEHYKGDIQEICEISKPDIAVVTGINESHLERMKTLENITSTIFEVVSGAKGGALVLLNGDDSRVMENYEKFIGGDARVLEYKVENFKSKVFDTEKLCWKAQTEDLGQLEINLLGEYAMADVDAAVKIAKELGIEAPQIISGIKKIKPVEHRLQPLPSSGGVLVIDDSYNGNPQGVAEAIKVLSRFTNRRKLFITPGLVEMGSSAQEVHINIGKQLAGVADVVILIKNSVTPFIEEGINSVVSSRVHPRNPLNDAPQIIWFDSATQAHAGLKNILKPGDVIVFQNDWGDQYV